MNDVKEKKREWSSSWWFLKSHLQNQGFHVYPTEIICSGKHCPVPDRSLIADVAAEKNGEYYAFEYKSLGDNINSPRLMEQINNYSVSFDYVIVVAEVDEKGHRYEASVNPKRGTHMREILALGAGFWTVHFPHYTYNPGQPPIFTEIAPPKQQQPNPENKQWIINKFKRYVFGQPVALDPNQTTLFPLRKS